MLIFLCNLSEPARVTIGEMMPIARSVDRNLKFTLVQSSIACPLSPPWTVSNRYMITPVGPGLGAATQRACTGRRRLRQSPPRHPPG